MRALYFLPEGEGRGGGGNSPLEEVLAPFLNVQALFFFVDDRNEFRRKMISASTRNDARREGLE